MDKEVEAFIKLFEDSSLSILELIRANDNYSTRRQQQMLASIAAIIATVQTESAQKLLQIIEGSYKKGSDAAAGVMRIEGKKGVNATFKTRIHKEAVQSIVDEAFYSILEATDHMSADVKKRIEGIVKTANTSSLVEGVTRKEATKRAAAEATERGITGIITKNGANVPVEKYMSGSIHYHQRKAHVDGAINRAIDNGQDLVYVNSVGITCSYCAQYQGRVYSISGNDKRFPELEVRPPYHSHCVHNAYPWNIEYQDKEDVALMLKESNRPFKDNRTEENIKHYNNMQRKKSKQNETRKQWVRYKSRMPDAPDLKTFASHKARNTSLYKDLQTDYRKVGAKIKEGEK